MTYRDKSYKTGHDELDMEIMDAYNTLQQLVPIHQLRRIEHRIHDGIMLRMKENSTRVCRKTMKAWNECVNTRSGGFLGWNQCMAARDAMNECFRDQNSEENYQKVRLQFLRGELFDQYKAQTKAKVEMYKAILPGLPMPEGKAALYAERICDSSDDTSQIVSVGDPQTPQDG
ncbi:hypothetical protein XU18_4443 [Perkinsela sp. CCAP 1560/4]|nr:hypothetical protein XU18_4443 [Perkinsela sp. CCAP 1560/4]|eukprot:KNH04233.1 hypothetical protein XU18_4443 [Perkinsela sp. CCAP 1560/4]